MWSLAPALFSFASFFVFSRRYENSCVASVNIPHTSNRYNRSLASFLFFGRRSGPIPIRRVTYFTVSRNRDIHVTHTPPLISRAKRENPRNAVGIRPKSLTFSNCWYISIFCHCRHQETKKSCCGYLAVHQSMKTKHKPLVLNEWTQDTWLAPNQRIPGTKENKNSVFP